MKIDIDNKIVQELVDSQVLTFSGNIRTVEARALEVARRQRHAIEQITGIVIKEFQKRDLLPYYKK